MPRLSGMGHRWSCYGGFIGCNVLFICNLKVSSGLSSVN